MNIRWYVTRLRDLKGVEVHDLKEISPRIRRSLVDVQRVEIEVRIRKCAWIVVHII